MPAAGGEPEAGIVQQVALQTRRSLHRGLGGREAGREPEVGLLVYLNPFLCDAKSSQCFRESNILLRTKQNLIQTHEDRGFPVVHTVKNLPAVQETGVPSLGWEDPLEKGMAIHSSILAWDIPWTEKTGRLQFVGAQRVRHA